MMLNAPTTDDFESSDDDDGIDANHLARKRSSVDQQNLQLKNDTHETAPTPLTIFDKDAPRPLTIFDKDAPHRQSKEDTQAEKLHHVMKSSDADDSIDAINLASKPNNVDQPTLHLKSTTQEDVPVSLAIIDSDPPRPQSKEDNKDKKLRRVIANRRAAKESRERRKHHLSKLLSTVNALTSANRNLLIENGQLRERVKELSQEMQKQHLNISQQAVCIQNNPLNSDAGITVGIGVLGAMETVNPFNNMGIDQPLSLEQQLCQQQHRLIQDMRAQEQRNRMLQNHFQQTQGAVPPDRESQEQLQHNLFLAIALQRANNQNQL